MREVAELAEGRTGVERQHERKPLTDERHAHVAASARIRDETTGLTQVLQPVKHDLLAPQVEHNQHQNNGEAARDQPTGSETVLHGSCAISRCLQQALLGLALAVDAVARVRDGLEAFLADQALATFADAVDAFLDAVEGLVDLAQRAFVALEQLEVHLLREAVRAGFARGVGDGIVIAERFLFEAIDVARQDLKHGAQALFVVLQFLLRQLFRGSHGGRCQ